MHLWRRPRTRSSFLAPAPICAVPPAPSRSSMTPSSAPPPDADSIHAAAGARQNRRRHAGPHRRSPLHGQHHAHAHAAPARKKPLDRLRAGNRSPRTPPPTHRAWAQATQARAARLGTRAITAAKPARRCGLDQPAINSDCGGGGCRSGMTFLNPRRCIYIY